MLWIALAWGSTCYDQWTANVLPYHGDVTAPPNVVLRFARPGVRTPDPPRLFNLDGEGVPADLVEEANYVELWPVEPLPEGDYEISALGSFEVAGPPDETPPSEPEFVEVWKRSRHGVGWTFFEFAPVPAEHHVEIQASEDENFAHDVHTVLSLHGPTETFHRDSGCGVMPAGYDHGARYHLRARTVDLAGNASDWVSHPPARVRCGCSSSRGHVGIVGLLLGVGLLRRRSTSREAKRRHQAKPGR